MIERLPTIDIMPHWLTVAGNMTVRYAAYPQLRIAYIQREDDPETLFVVSDQKLPETLAEALQMTIEGLEANEAA